MRALVRFAGNGCPFVGEAGIDFVFDSGTRLGLSLEGARDAKGYLLGANLDMRFAF